jgi:hypothetical protein
MIVSLDVKIEEYCTTISDDDRYEHQGYLDAEKANYEAIDRLIDTTAQSWTGMRVEADALMIRQIYEDRERSAAKAWSLADDVLQISSALGV